MKKLDIIGLINTAIISKEMCSILFKYNYHYSYHLENSLCSTFQCLSSSCIIALKYHLVTKPFNHQHFAHLGHFACCIYKMPFWTKFCTQVTTEIFPNKFLQIRLQYFSPNDHDLVHTGYTPTKIRCYINRIEFAETK